MKHILINVNKYRVFFSLYIAIIIILSLFSSCEEDKGCMDPKALNHDFSVQIDDGSCSYSRVTFYASSVFFDRIDRDIISRINVSINGNQIGSTLGIDYANGPAHCSAYGTVPFEFLNGDSIEWYATFFLENGTTKFKSGQVSPSPSAECIKVDLIR